MNQKWCTLPRNIFITSNKNWCTLARNDWCNRDNGKSVVVLVVGNTLYKKISNNKNGLPVAEKPFSAEIYLSKWSRRESNSYLKFRKLLFYPLNYGTILFCFANESSTK